MRGLILLTFLGSALAGSQQGDRIVGGIAADIEKYPYMASMQFDWYESSWRHSCGGSIITIRTILSAAHCFDQRNSPVNWRTRVGSSYLTSGGQIHTIQKFIIHENYNDLFLNNDVAIVKLAAPVTLSASVGTARIANPYLNVPDGAQVTSMGWGRLSVSIGSALMQILTAYPTSGGQIHTIQKFIIHENYNDLFLNNDVAIVKLAAPVTLSASVGTARIANSYLNVPDGTQVTSMGWGRLSVSIGSALMQIFTAYPTSGGQIYTIQKFIIHENYNDLFLNNDVAIVKLAAPVTLSASVGTARIANSYLNVPDGTQVTSMGWGRLSSGGDLPEQLQEVDNYVVNQELCWERYEILRTQPENLGYPEVTDRMICAGVLGSGGRDTCQGDSGGPMIYGDVIIGITSWAYGCADPYYPGVKARVSSFVTWIVSNGSW